MTEDDDYRFKLYVAGADTAGSLRAIANFKRLSELYLGKHYRLEVIDIVQSPERAFADHIVATPTLVKDAPPPRFKIVGDLSTRQQQVNELFSFVRGE